MSVCFFLSKAPEVLMTHLCITDCLLDTVVDLLLDCSAPISPTAHTKITA